MFVRDQVLFRPGSVEGELSTINHCNTHDLVGRWGSNHDEDYEREQTVGMVRRRQNQRDHCAHHPVVSDASGGVGLVTG